MSGLDGRFRRQLIGCRLYDMTMAVGSTRRFHAKQMQLSSAQLTDEIITEFA
jgi:hypothetical protein